MPAPQPRILWLAAWLVAAACSAGNDDRGWPVYGADGATSRYSPLDEIDASNFARLTTAWTWESADLAWREAWEQRWKKPPKTDLTDFQLTPLVIGRVLYGITSLGFAFALEADTGRELWVTDLGAYRMPGRNPARLPAAPTHRGVAYWREGNDERIYALAYNSWLVALDAKTGRPVAGFGREGRVDLLENLLGPRPRRGGQYVHKSPPAIVGDTIVVGSSVGDRPNRLPATRGDVRGYDVRTGSYKWTFHTVPLRGQEGVETWAGDSWRFSGAANVWGPMSVDPALGTVYVVTSASTNDFYGGHRVGDNLFSQSLLCLDGETGRRVWHQQLIRHGLWDYDLAAPPNLLDIEVAGRRISAVAQVTKQGFTFVFDRETGAPVWPIEDRPVPPSDVPGEVASPTQRFPTRPPPFERQGALEEHLVDFTPELRAKALEVFRRYRTGPLFTPPSLQGTLLLPGPSGGANWQGAGADPTTGTLYVGSIMMPTVLSVLPGAQTGRRSFRYVAGMSQSIPGWVEVGISMFEPPYSRITAFDLNRGEIVWQVPNGDGPRDAPSLRGLDLPPLGSQARTCVLVTPDLVIAGDGAEHFFPRLGQPLLHAYDKGDGRRLGDIALPGQTTGCPITYSVDGRQYIAIATGGLRYRPILAVLRLP